jgi:DNA-binding SARP family transcriptional activator
VVVSRRAEDRQEIVRAERRRRLTPAETQRKINVNVLRLLTFGVPALESGDGSGPARVRPPRLAMLAVLAASGDRGVSRERLAGLLWPDSDEERARHSLRQALYELKQELGVDVVRTEAAAIALDPSRISSDVQDFYRALATGDRVLAVSLSQRPFLEAFYLSELPAFERWVEDERARLSAAAIATCVQLASEADQSGNHDGAIEWWRRLVGCDPLSGRFALGYIRALAGRGDRAEALAFIREYRTRVRRELETDADPSIGLIESELRAITTPESTRNGYTDTTEAHRPIAHYDGDRSSAAHPGRVNDPRPDIDLRLGVTTKGARILSAASLLLAVALLVLFVRQFDSRGPDTTAPTFAVGLVQVDESQDSLRTVGVLTDMLATSLARVGGLSVVGNTRLVELTRVSRDTSPAGYAAAARKAGATELLEGRLTTAAPGQMVLEMRRVNLITGLVSGSFRVTAADRFALVDSATTTIARSLALQSPVGSIADATTRSAIAYRLYEEGLRAFYQWNHAGALTLMRAALSEDSTFALAAYYESLLVAPGDTALLRIRDRALRLARRAPDRERLMITAEIQSRNLEPSAMAIAESLAARYPEDPRAFATLASTRIFWGDWAGAVAAIERAIAGDSAAESVSGASCRLCDDFVALADIYFWWDSLPAVERVVERYLRVRPGSHEPWMLRATAAARRGDRPAAHESLRRMAAQDSGRPWDPVFAIRINLALEDWVSAEREGTRLIASLRVPDYQEGRWLLFIALRNQGRLREAWTLFHTGSLPGVAAPLARQREDHINEAILLLESGNPVAAADLFARNRPEYARARATGMRARLLTWSGTLQGMSLALAADTAGLRRLADSVEAWGRESLYGRDQKSHHFLRGSLLAAAGRHEDAVREYRQAIHSNSLGFTHVNYDLATCLLRLGRPLDAVAVLQPALRGEIDASNLYVTRTALHERLAEAFIAAGNPDSGAAHYRAVVKAWKHADPQFHARRDRAIRWLGGHRDD